MYIEHHIFFLVWLSVQRGWVALKLGCIYLYGNGYIFCLLAYIYINVHNRHTYTYIYTYILFVYKITNVRIHTFNAKVAVRKYSGKNMTSNRHIHNRKQMCICYTQLYNFPLYFLYHRHDHHRRCCRRRRCPCICITNLNRCWSKKKTTTPNTILNI